MFVLAMFILIGSFIAMLIGFYNYIHGDEKYTGSIYSVEDDTVTIKMKGKRDTPYLEGTVDANFTEEEKKYIQEGAIIKINEKGEIKICKKKWKKSEIKKAKKESERLAKLIGWNNEKTS